MKPSKSRDKRPQASPALADPPEEHAFAEVMAMIQAARGQALAAVNTALIDLYWRVGEYISRQLESAAWGDGVVEALARYIQRHHPNLKGFTRRNLFRMRQFFEAYKGDEKVSPLVRQLPLELGWPSWRESWASSSAYSWLPVGGVVRHCYAPFFCGATFDGVASRSPATRRAYRAPRAATKRSSSATVNM